MSLKSAILSNPNVDVALVTNQQLPIEYVEMFKSAGIKLILVRFEKYQMPDTFQWQYAFYKLNALEYIVTFTDYDYILGLDTDTYVKGNLDNLWIECKYDLPVLYGLDSIGSVKKQIEYDYLNLFNSCRYIQQIGGEFIAGSKKGLQLLIKQNEKVYQVIKSNDFNIDEKSGDEAILSMSASMIEYVSARPFVRRYWTRKAYYDVDFAAESIPIWHLPAEKNYGLIKAFNILKTKNELPSNKEMMKLFNLPRPKFYNISMIKYYIYRLFHSV